jgi:hypothetical protein
MFVTLRQYGYVCHIAIMWLWPVMFITLRQYGYMFVTLRQYGYDISHVYHITKIWLCSSHCDTRCYVRQIERLANYGAMFVALQDSRLCSSHSRNMVMFVTLRQQSYVRHIVTIWQYSSHYDKGAMFVILRR